MTEPVVDDLRRQIGSRNEKAILVDSGGNARHSSWPWREAQEPSLQAKGRLYDEEAVARPKIARMTGTGRLHSVTNGSFWEAKFQWRLSGDELEKMAVVSRPLGDIQVSTMQ